MPDSRTKQHQIANLFARRLDGAIKAMRLYPPEHVMCMDAVAAFKSCLTDLLSEQPQVAIAHHRRALHVNGLPVSNEVAGSGAIAQCMRMAGIQEITLGASCRRSEIYEFLGALCMDSRQLRAEGGLQSYFDIRGVEHITVLENRLEVVNAADEAGPDSDPLATIQAEAASMEEILANPGITASNRRQALIRFSAPKERLAKMLALLAAKHSGTDDDWATECVTRIIPKAAAIFSEELPDDRAFLSRNLAEALLALPRTQREPIIAKIMVAAGTETASVCAALIGGLSDKSVAGILRDIATASSLTASQTADIISKLPIDPARMKAIARRLDDRPTNEDGAVVAALGSTQAQAPAARTRQRLPSRPEVDYLSKLIVPLNEIERKELERLAGNGFETDVRHHTTMSLLTIFFKESDPQESECLAPTLMQHFYRCVGEGSLSDAITMIYACRRVMDAHPLDPKNHKLALSGRLVREAASPEQISRLMDSATSAPTLDLSRFRDYFQALGPHAVNGLVDRLATEDGAGTRKIICFLLRDLGAPIVEELAAKLSDSRWYLVRNIVMVLGSVGTDKALLALRGALSHPDARVRFEVAAAAGKAASPHAQRMLEVLLDDQDGRVRKNAAAALLRAGAVDPLRAVLVRPDFLHLCYRQKMDVCQTIAEQGQLVPAIGSPLVQALRSIVRRRPLIFRRKHRCLAAAAASAMQVTGEASVA